jgi:hypothetical protein
MHEPIYEFSLDLLLFGRMFLALLWGVSYALFLQHVRLGQFLVEKRTWLTVVVGVGVDLGISYGGNWWTIVIVMALSAIGILARSLINESKAPHELGAYQRKWVLRDAIAFCDEVRIGLRALLRDRPDDGNMVANLSEALELLDNQRAQLREALEGRYMARGEID